MDKVSKLADPFVTVSISYFAFPIKSFLFWPLNQPGNHQIRIGRSKKHQKQTQVAAKTRNPVWDEDFRIEASATHTNNAILKLELQ